VYPGDGVAPLTEILKALKRSGGEKVLSLEIFNRKYWTEDPLEVARAGLSKMKAATAQI
jgi:sugar phosphate isomerase/epimerase